MQFDGRCPSAAIAVIQATCDYLSLIRQEHPDCSGKRSFEPLIDAAITNSIRRVLTRQQADSEGPQLSGIAASAASWAIYGAAREWSFTPGREPVDEIVPRILAFVLPMLQTAGTKNADSKATVSSLA